MNIQLYITHCLEKCTTNVSHLIVPDEKVCSSQEETKSVETGGETEKKVSSEEKEHGSSDGLACTKLVDEEIPNETTQEDTKGQLDSSEQEIEKDKRKTGSSQQKHEEVEASSDSEEELSVDAAIKVLSLV